MKRLKNSTDAKLSLKNLHTKTGEIKQNHRKKAKMAVKSEKLEQMWKICTDSIHPVHRFLESL